MRSVRPSKSSPHISHSDEEWGYEFGCEGFVSVKKACTHIGVSRPTLDRYVARKLIRKGKDKDNGTVKICWRSVVEYKRNQIAEV